MKKRGWIIAIIVLIGVVLFAVPKIKAVSVNKDDPLLKLQSGMTKEDIHNLFGTPFETTSAFFVDTEKYETTLLKVGGILSVQYDMDGIIDFATFEFIAGAASSAKDAAIEYLEQVALHYTDASGSPEWIAEDYKGKDADGKVKTYSGIYRWVMDDLNVISFYSAGNDFDFLVCWDKPEK